MLSISLSSFMILLLSLTLRTAAYSSSHINHALRRDVSFPQESAQSRKLIPPFLEGRSIRPATRALYRSIIDEIGLEKFKGLARHISTEAHNLELAKVPSLKNEAPPFFRDLGRAKKVLLDQVTKQVDEKHEVVQTLQTITHELIQALTTLQEVRSKLRVEE